MKELIGKTLGNYRLQRILGRGRMGVVFLAHDRALLRPTALKLLAWSLENGIQDPIKWFLSEARSVAQISHPNVIQIYNIAKHAEHRYIAMEYVDGASVEQVLLKKGRFSVKHATDVLIQTSAALEAAHKCSVIHRDIKPANILLRKDGVVKLSDFGMAISTHSDAVLTAAMRVGTPYFNAPETWEGRPASPASDIYALGVTYFLLLTGHLPFKAQNMHELQWKHIHEPIPDPREHVPSLPAFCKEIVDACMEKRPHLRIANPKALGAEAAKLLASLKAERSQKENADALSSAPPAYALKPGYEPANETWSRALAFSIDPFGSVDPLSLPYNGDPFDKALSELNRAVKKNKKLIILHGEPGSGKTTLCQRHVLQYESKYTVIFVSSDTTNTGSPIIEICRIAGVDPRKADALDDVVEWLGRNTSNRNGGTLLYVDDCPENEGAIRAVSDLLNLVNRVERCSLVVVASTRVKVLLKVKLKGADIAAVSLRPLRPREVVDYVRAWIKKALLPVAPLLLVTTDACLVAAYLSNGNLTALNRILRFVLQMSASREQRIISTWEVWNSRIRTSESDSSIAEVSPQPPLWPISEVAEIIDEYRLKAGFEPVALVSKSEETEVVRQEERQ